MCICAANVMNGLQAFGDFYPSQNDNLKEINTTAYPGRLFFNIKP